MSQNVLSDNTKVPLSWLAGTIIASVSAIIAAVPVTLYISAVESKANQAMDQAADVRLELQEKIKTDQGQALINNGYLGSIDQRLSRIEGYLSKERR